MANFQYANNPQTTLSGAATAGATSISVASGAAFPARGKFTIIVDSEIMLVTGVSGLTWTVERGYDGTSAAAHNNNAAVTAILTKRSFLNAHRIDVRAYGAAGDGLTDDTAAIMAAIADIPAGGGTLFFPPGTYLTSGGFILDKTTRVLGGGSSARDDAAPRPAISRIVCTSATAALFTVQGHASIFDNIALECTAASPTAGGGIVITAGDHMRLRNVSVTGFWINVDFQDGAHWSMDDCHLWAPVKYALKIQHIDLVDGGDQSISNCFFNADVRNADAGIRVESGGGLKIVNCKINTDMGGSVFFIHGIDVAVGNNVLTSDLQITNVSIENVTGDAFHMTTSATSSGWDHVVITNLQTALYAGNTTGSAISIAATTIGDIDGVIIDGCVLRGFPGSAAPAIKLTKVQAVQIGDYIHLDFARGLTVSGSDDVAASGGGLLGLVQVTANQAGIGSTETNVTGLVTTAARRLAHHLRVTARLRWTQSTGTDTVRFRIYKGTTVIQEWTDSAGDTNSQTYFDQVLTTTPVSTGGSDTYRVTAQVVIGAGTLTITAAATYPAFLMVEDLGPTHA